MSERKKVSPEELFRLNPNDWRKISSYLNDNDVRSALVVRGFRYSGVEGLPGEIQRLASDEWRVVSVEAKDLMNPDQTKQIEQMQEGTKKHPRILVINQGSITLQEYKKVIINSSDLIGRWVPTINNRSRVIVGSEDRVDLRFGSNLNEPRPENIIQLETPSTEMMMGSILSCGVNVEERESHIAMCVGSYGLLAVGLNWIIENERVDIRGMVNAIEEELKKGLSDTEWNKILGWAGRFNKAHQSELRPDLSAYDAINFSIKLSELGLIDYDPKSRKYLIHPGVRNIVNIRNLPLDKDCVGGFLEICRDDLKHCKDRADSLKETGFDLRPIEDGIQKIETLSNKLGEENADFKIVFSINNKLDRIYQFISNIQRKIKKKNDEEARRLTNLHKRRRPRKSNRN